MKCLRPVEAQCFMSSTARDRQTMRPIGTGVADRVHRDGYQCAIFLDAAAHTDNHRVTKTSGSKLLLSAILDAHRMVRLHRKYRRDRFQQHLLFTTKAPAHSWFHHSYL